MVDEVFGGGDLHDLVKRIVRETHANVNRNQRAARQISGAIDHGRDWRDKRRIYPQATITCKKGTQSATVPNSVSEVTMEQF
jgi:hypothetical protein